MILKLERKHRAEKYTIGKLYIDGEFFCDTLEDTDRDRNKNGSLNDEGEGKVYGETAIPYGTYDVRLSMSPRFGRVLPELLNVPHFTGIRIHRGNTHHHTHGCILVGFNKIKGQVINSAQTEADLIRKLRSAKGKIIIDIV
jgi:hypothetical protein